VGTRAATLAERVVVVLVQPIHPGNVGATARAMRNFGLERLVLVDPPAYDPERARWMAPGCADLLDRARIVGTLDEALEGVHRAIGTPARHRRSDHRVVEPHEAAAHVLGPVGAGVSPPRDDVTAILFGREDNGLSNEELARCEVLVRIATPEHASLNLAQAVLLVAHHLYEEARRHGEVASGRTLGGTKPKATRELARRSPKDARADLPKLEPAVEELVALLARVGYTRSAPEEKVRVTARQALQAAGLTARQVDALRGMVSRVGWAHDHPGVDWTKTKAGTPGAPDDQP
jgi:TrmH family RNA methyltransferase